MERCGHYWLAHSLLLIVFPCFYQWLQVAGALAEEGMGLEEITKRVSVIAKTMGECRPGMGGLWQTWGLRAGFYQLYRSLSKLFPGASGRSSGESLAALGT